jgi:hypothetical protein
MHAIHRSGEGSSHLGLGSDVVVEEVAVQRRLQDATHHHDWVPVSAAHTGRWQRPHNHHHQCTAQSMARAPHNRPPQLRGSGGGGGRKVLLYVCGGVFAARTRQ